MNKTDSSSSFYSSLGNVYDFILQRGREMKTSKDTDYRISSSTATAQTKSKVNDQPINSASTQAPLVNKTSLHK
jgi:hypothetical protein